MAYRSNQYPYSAQHRSSPPPLPPPPDMQQGQAPPPPRPPAGPSSNLDPRAYGQPPTPGYGSYGQASPSLPYTQSQMSGPRPRPPYPTYSYDDPPSMPPGSPQQYQYPYHPSPPSQPSYNPQSYAQSQPSAPYPPMQFQGPPVPPRPYNVRPPPPQPYNPAAYSPALNQQSSIASTANQMYGHVNGNQTPIQSQHGGHIYSSMSPPVQQLPASPGYPSINHNQQAHHTQSPNYFTQNLSGSAPLPSRPFPIPPGQAPRDPTNNFLNSTDAFPRYLSPVRGQALGTIAPRTPPSDLRDNRSAPGLQNSQHLASPTHAGYSEQNTVAPVRNQEPDWTRYDLGRIDTSGRHPQSRPLPGPPPDLEPDSAPTYTAGDEIQHFEYYGDDFDQDQLFDELENAVGNGSRSSVEQCRDPASDEVQRSPNEVRNDNWGTNDRTNGLRASQDSTSTHHDYGDYSDDSDAEAAAGLEAMAIAAEEDHRRKSQQSAMNVNITEPSEADSHTPEEDLESDEDDYGLNDLSSLGGGFEVAMSYGGDPSLLITSLPTDDNTKLRAQHPSTSSRGSAARSADGHPVRSSSHTSLTDNSGTSPLPVTAHVDQTGTGGLYDPSLYLRKMSFDDSSENISIDEHAAAGPDMSAGPPDLPYSSSVSMNRPLPPTPQAGEPQSGSSSVYSSISPTLTYAPDTNTLNHQVMAPDVPRSTSLWSHPRAPRPMEPVRAKTDGRRQGLRLSTYNVDLPTSDGFGIQTPSHVGLGIPSLPLGRRFHPSKLTQKDFDSCTEPWALSGISAWLRSMAEGESELREHSILEALVALFTTKVPNMNITIVESLAADTLGEFCRAEVLVHEEEWLKFGRGSVTGVLYQLTGQGCYSPFLHSKEISGRCYAPHCQTMVKKVSLDAQRGPQTTDWATFYNLSKEERDRADKTKVELQNNLHEIVTSEDAYMNELYVLSALYRDGLKSANPAIIAPAKLTAFLQDVFGKLEAVKAANEDHLLPQLRYRQQEQGPWISGFTDIFRHWIRKAKAAYIEYAANFPNANFLMKQEEGRNSMFVAFVEGVRNKKMSNRLEWSSFLRAPITRLQRYSLLLATVQKHMPPENVGELSNLQLALKEIRAVTMECDSKVAESGKKADLYELDSILRLRPEMKGVELSLQQYGRKILLKGDLQRAGKKRFSLIPTHTLLLDNFLVLSKTEPPSKDSAGGVKYDISKMPIPMDLLVLESTNDAPVERSYKGVSSVTPATNDPRHTRTNSSLGLGTLSHTATNSSLSTLESTSSGKNMVPTTTLGESSDSKTLYPFRIKHLGRETYTLYANSAELRKTWCDKIIDAKTDHAASLFAQNAEPFKLRVIADSAFASDTIGGAQKSILIKGSPLGRAVNEIDKMYAHQGRPGPICRARVNCATAFVQPNGTQMVAIGTDYGVYIAENGSPRGWSRSIPGVKVTQVAVLEDFNLLILISDKSLIAYHLDVVCPPNGAAPKSDTFRKAPQKLSGSRDVAFFVTAKMKDRTLIFYKKNNMSSSTFKILEPILQRVSEAKSRSFLGRGNTISFRDYDEFYIPTDCTALDVFTSTLAVATSKGLEILNLDKKTPFSVPDLKAAPVATIASRLAGAIPLGMFRLNELEFLCVYDECAVYVNKHGDISRSVVMEFVGKARAAALEGGYLILFDQDFIEIRNAQAGSLKQVIVGEDMRCLDNGRGSTGASNKPRSIKFALQHPEQDKTQLVVELVMDETRRL